MAPVMGTLCLLLGANIMAEQQPEFRAGWVTRFEWPDRDPERCKAKITEVFETAASANLNAVIFQIRGEADVLYPSELEPWSQLIGGKDPGFDPLAFAIAEARKHGIEFHAYMNAMPLRSTSLRQPPHPDHLWHRHGPDSPEPWVCRDEQGRPTREEYVYMSAAIPEVHAYVRRVITDVVSRYDVDGIHLDRVRYPGPEFIHDPVGERRFRDRGNPNLLDRADWQRQQLDKLINDLAAEMRAIRPSCVLSCSAWGIYNRHHIDGYGEFSSGYHDYYQDTWNWCRLGAMDLLMPMIYWNIPDPKPNYDELMKDFARGVGARRVVGGQRIFSPPENVAQVTAGREIDAAGAVFFTLNRSRSRGILSALKASLYAEQAAVPKPQRLTEPTTGDIFGTVTTGSGAPLVDAWVSLEGRESSRRSRRSRRGGSARTWTSSADGRFAFLDVPPGPATVRVHYIGAAPVQSTVEVQAGSVARLDVAVPDADQAKDLPFVQILAPKGAPEVTTQVVHVMGRTSPDCTVEVGGESVEVFSTGAFARDGIALTLGENRIPITVTNPAGRSHTEELMVVRREPAPPAPSPAKETRTEPVTETWDSSVVRVGEARRDGVPITHGIHSVRLGGPWLGRMTEGTRFEIIGQSGEHLRIALSRSLSGWVPASQVNMLPEGTPVPHNYFTGCHISGDEDHDIVSVGLREKVVFAVSSDPDSTLQGARPNRIHVDFFNTHHALTWISHKSGARIVGPVTGEQLEDGRFRLTLPVNCRQIWGYWTEMQGNTLKLYVRRPPTIAEPPDSPLKGLLFALEAGHGGSNSGAVGRMGTKEKDVNLAAVLALEEALEQRGAQTIQVRPRDSSPSLRERVDRANAAGADFYVSMHANAAGNTRGFLAISGTSTYYLDAHCYLPADLVYRRLLDLDWQEFGVVGNFSYSPLTNTRTPGILVEQAFMSNPYDEARLLDAAYQQQQAEAIVAGLEEFFDAARE